MKNLNDTNFNIEKTTMRELNQDEIIEIAGGSWVCIIALTAVINVAEDLGTAIGEAAAEIVIQLS